MIIIDTTALLTRKVSIGRAASEIRFLSLYLVHEIGKKLYFLLMTAKINPSLDTVRSYLALLENAMDYCFFLATISKISV